MTKRNRNLYDVTCWQQCDKWSRKISKVPYLLVALTWKHAYKTSWSFPLTVINITSKRRRHAVEMYASATSAFSLAVILTFDLWSWKPFQQFSLTWWLFVASFIEIPSLSTDISRHVKNFMTSPRPWPLTYDLWPWNLFQQLPLTRRLLASCVKLHWDPFNKWRDIALRGVGVNGRTTHGQWRH